MKPHIQFLTSAADEQQFPALGAPEIALLGRSNVGKSSLLNSLAGSRIAKVSSTPGRTRTINFFTARWSANSAAPDFLLVDLPGYGYARVSRELSASWANFVDPYLEKRRTLALCVVLLDANVPPQASDRQLVEFLRTLNRKFVAVATKADKLSGSRLRHVLQKLAEAHALGEVIAYSAKSGLGRTELWHSIQRVLEVAAQSPLQAER